MKNTAGPLRVGMIGAGNIGAGNIGAGNIGAGNIGAGNIGANYLRAARFFDQMKVVVCADLNAACFGQPEIK